MKRNKRLVIFAALITALCFGACGKKTAEDSTGTGYLTHQKDSDLMREAANKYPPAAENSYTDSGSAYGGHALYDPAPMATSAPADSGGTQQPSKIIRTGNIDMRTKTFEDTVQQMKNLVMDAGGFIGDSNAYVYANYSGRDYRSGNYTFRVPQESYETVKSALEALGQVVTSSDSTRDVTTEYYDTAGRLQSARAQEESLLGMIARATDLTDLILLEERLSEVRTQIEIHQSRINTIDRQSSFSTIHVNLTEVQTIEPIKLEPSTMWEKIQNSFIGSVNGVLSFFGGLIIGLVGIAIPLVIIGIALFVAWRIIRRSLRKRTAAKNAAQTIKEEEVQADES